VQAVKGGSTSLTLLPPLVLNGRNNHPTAAAEKVMRDLAPLGLAEISSLVGST
jgi:tRNA1(Val) A37 N6-methylase TrmN6